MFFTFKNLTKNKISKALLEKVLEKSISTLKPKDKEINLIVVGDKEIKELNKNFRNKNEVTDVLSFDYGDIFICFPQIKRQAKEFGHSVEKELATMIVHGILHVSGYDHEKSKKQSEQMFSLQDKIVNSLKIK